MPKLIKMHKDLYMLLVNTLTGRMIQHVPFISEDILLQTKNVVVGIARLDYAAMTTDCESSRYI